MNGLINSTEIRVYMTRRDNMSVAGLAYLLGKSPATVGRWLERGDMPVEYAERIIDILQIPPPEAINIFFACVVAGHATSEAKRNAE